MAQANLLISIPDVMVHQRNPAPDGNSNSISTQPTTLFESTSLNLQLIDIPSSVLKSIPNSSEPPSYDLSSKNSHQPPSEATLDTWLVLSLAEGLIEVPLSQSSKVTFKPPRSYLVQISSENEQLENSDRKPSGSSHHAYLQLDFADHISSDTLDTFDSILAGWTQFTGRQSSSSRHLSADQIPPKSITPPPPSHPLSQNEKTDPFQSKFPPPSSAYQNGTASNSAFPNEGRLALMDESTGEICGELTSDISLQAPVVGQHTPPFPTNHANQTNIPAQNTAPPFPLVSALRPVIVSIISSNQPSAQPRAQVSLAPANPSKSNSQIISGAEWISRGIIAGSEVISNMIIKSGNSYLTSTQPTTVPMTFSSRAHTNADKVLGFTHSASKVSGKTAAVIGSVVGRVGDSIGKSTGIQRSPSGQPPTGARGYVHKGLVAFNTVFDSLETSGKKLLATAGDTTTSVVTHAYGPEAGEIAQRMNHAVRNVSLVYIDARGVTRKAVLKSVGKAAIRGRMDDGREVILASDQEVNDWTVLPKPDHPSLPPPSSSFKPPFKN